MKPNFFYDRFYKQAIKKSVLIPYHDQKVHFFFYLKLINGLYDPLIGKVVKKMGRPIKTFM